MLRSPDLAALILRLALASIFITQGGLKLRHEGGTAWYPDDTTLSPTLQVTVAWGEVGVGVALALGLLTRLAALGSIVIMLGAIYYVTWKLDFTGGTDATTHNMQLQVGYEYNYAIIAMAVSLVILGAGALSIDHLLFHRSHAPAAAAPQSGGAVRV
jgi:putative oxidoreductase